MRGCTGVDDAGNIPCQPEKLRAHAEAWLREAHPELLAQMGGALSLEVYTLARYIQSEIGSGTVEERVAVGEAARNQARAWKLADGVLGLLLYRQPIGHVNRGWYGPIHPSAGTVAAPYGRWASTRQAPTVATLACAHLVASGESGDFARGAITQWGPDHPALGLDTAEKVLAAMRRQAVKHRHYWVGPLPGVDPWATQLFYRGPVYTIAAEPLVQRAAAGLPLTDDGRPIRPDWSGLSVCARGVGVLELLVLLAGLGVLYFFTR